MRLFFVLFLPLPLETRSRYTIPSFLFSFLLSVPPRSINQRNRQRARARERERLPEKEIKNERKEGLYMEEGHSSVDRRRGTKMVDRCIVDMKWTARDCTVCLPIKNRAGYYARAFSRVQTSAKTKGAEGVCMRCTYALSRWSKAMDRRAAKLLKRLPGQIASGPGRTWHTLPAVNYHGNC